MIASHPETEASHGLQRFAFQLWEHMPSTGNFVISPYSAAVALAMAADGATGETRREIVDVMGMETNTIAGWSREIGKRLKEANLLTYDPMFSIREEYVKLLTSRWGSLVGNPLQDESIVIENHIDFHGLWPVKFVTQGIHPWGNTKPVAFMQQTGYYRYSNINGQQILWLTYAPTCTHPGIQFALILDDDISSPLHVGLSKQLGKRTYIRLTMPSFAIHQDWFRLGNALKGMGINRAFSPLTAQFDYMSTDQLCIDMVRQKASVRVTETGTTADATTQVQMTSGCGWLSEPLDIVVNKPFRFAIVCKDMVLFVGRVETP